MPIVRGNQGNDIIIGVGVEMDKKAAEEVKAAIKSMSAEERAAIESQIQGERLLAQVEGERAKSLALAAKRQTDAIKAQTDAQNQYRAGLMKSREEAQRMAGVANQVSMLGAAVLAPFVGSLAKFGQSARAGDSVANEYRASMVSLEDSTLRLGRATADVLNPVLKETAKIVSDVVGVLEKNPGLLEKVLAVGGTALVGGQVVKGALQMEVMASTVQLAQMTASGGLAKGAVAGVTAGGGVASMVTAIAPYAISALMAAGVITIVSMALKETTGTGLDDMLKTETEFAKRLPEVFSGKIALNDLAAQAINNSAYKANPSGSAASFIGSLAGPKSDSEVDSWARAALAAPHNDFKRAVEAAKKAQQEVQAVTEKSDADRLAALKDLNAKRETIEKASAETTRSFLLADSQAHQDYYNNRMDTARAAGVEAERAEADHQKAIQKIQHDSDQRIYGMRLERDALGIATEKRNAESQRKESEDGYQTEIRRKNEDLADRFRIMDREFSLTNQRRLAEFSYNMQIKNAEVAAAQQMYNAIIQIANSAVAAVNGLAQTASSPMAVYASTPTAPPLDANGHYRGYAVGGLVDRTGPAIVHAGELVVNRQNRQMAENLISGPLTQTSLLNALRGGGGRASIVTNIGASLSIQQTQQMIDLSAKTIMRSIERSIAKA
jgi:hypothetical protein